MIHFIRRFWRKFLIAALRPMTEAEYRGALIMNGAKFCSHCGKIQTKNIWQL